MRTDCPACGDVIGDQTRHIAARERMFGLGHAFDYAVCAGCGTLWLPRVLSPEELAPYYGSGYYSHVAQSRGGIKQWLQSRRDRAALGAVTVVGAILARLAPDPVMQVLGQVGLTPDQRVLDVGCGEGALLLRLHGAGFRSLTGVDPFLAADRAPAPAVRLHATYLDRLDGTFDVIMFNHALEHVPDPATTLAQARARLAPGGLCLVRVPTPSSAVFETYGDTWVQLDAPRHLVLPSRDGMATLASRTGFRLARTIDDSTGFGFWGSELYRQDVALSPPGGPRADPRARFGQRRLAAWSREARALNALGRGDQAAFVLRAI